METRFKLRLSRIFHSSFSSCRSRNLSDIIEKAVFTPPINDQSFRFVDSMPVKLPPFPSICRSDSFETTESIDSLLPRRKILEPFSSAVNGGLTRTSPLVSPDSTLKSFSGSAEKVKATNNNNVKKTKKKKKKKKRTEKVNQFCPFGSSSVESNFGGTWWYSSDDEDETDTLFSSRSRSSDSSASHRRQKPRRKRSTVKQSSEMGLLPLKGKVKDSFAVVKKSSDPYSDFRSSMLEMIIEKQIFSANDLEQLLQCFLSLNSNHHHRVILEVFTEIWEALFSDWGS